MKDNKIIMISPKFFHIEKYIQEGFEKQGYNVDFYDERIDNKKLTKALLRKFPFVLKKRLDNYYQKIYRQLDKSVKMIFVVKAESTPVWFLKQVKENYPNIILIHYMFDPILNYPKILDKMPYFDYKLTFDKSDAIQYNWHFRPLFVPPIYQNVSSDSSDSQLTSKKGVFIGTLHTDRAIVINEILKEIPDEIKDNVFIYFYIPLWSMFLYGKYFKGNYKNVQREWIHKRPLSTNEVVSHILESDYVIDLHHDNQTGLTFRTMEVIGSCKKLITTNYHIKDYDFYNPNNILVIDKNNPVISSTWFMTDYEPIPNSVYSKYTLDGFINEIISLL